MSDQDDNRFDGELAAFGEDRAAFRSAVAELRERGEAILEHSQSLKDRSEVWLADLDRLKADVQHLREEVTARLGETLEEVEKQRDEAATAVAAAAEAVSGLQAKADADLTALSGRLGGEVETLLADAQEAHEKVLTRAHADYSSLILKTRAEHEALLVQAKADHDALVAQTRSAFEGLRDAVAKLEGGVADRMAAIEIHSAELGERMDAANVGLLQASADLAELLDRFDDLQHTETEVQAQVDRGARAVARVAGRTKALSQLRWALGLVSGGVGLSLLGVAAALGTAWGEARLGWLVGAVGAVAFAGVGAWVMLAIAPAPAVRPAKARPGAIPVPAELETTVALAPGELEPAEP